MMNVGVSRACSELRDNEHFLGRIAIISEGGFTWHAGV